MQHANMQRACLCDEETKKKNTKLWDGGTGADDRADDLHLIGAGDRVRSRMFE